MSYWSVPVYAWLMLTALPPVLFLTEPHILLFRRPLSKDWAGATWKTTTTFIDLHCLESAYPATCFCVLCRRGLGVFLSLFKEANSLIPLWIRIWRFSVHFNVFMAWTHLIWVDYIQAHIFVCPGRHCFLGVIFDCVFKRHACVVNMKMYAFDSLIKLI